jgi:hypothetical protein
MLGLWLPWAKSIASFYNHRKDEDGNPLKDGDRFDMAVRQIVGKRLTWDRLTGKESEYPLCH